MPETQLDLFTGPRTEGHPCDSTVIVCPYCKTARALEYWDVMGACEGNVICPDCITEVVAETGEPSDGCGECEFCFDG